jgi:hypothetical protein
MTDGRYEAFAYVISEKKRVRRCIDASECKNAPRKLCSLKDGDVYALSSNCGGGIRSSGASAYDENWDMLRWKVVVNFEEADWRHRPWVGT